MRAIVCVDINGVLDNYRGWQGAEHWDPPRAGAREFLQALQQEGYDVVVLTTRWHEDARAWLERHGLLEFVCEVTDRKPAAHVFVDDRALRFEGDFDATLREIRTFSAHWERSS
jgi:cation transport ATPase